MGISSFLLNLVVGAIPECIYYYFSFRYILNVPKKQGKLLAGIFLSYLLFIYGIPYDIISYFIFSLALYGVLYMLYKTKIQWIDLCVIFFVVSYLMITSYISFAIFRNQMEYYPIAYILQRVLMFLPVIFHKRIAKWYQHYRSIWNVEGNKSKHIKSITVRIFSILGMCLICFGMYAFIILILA